MNQETVKGVDDLLVGIVSRVQSMDLTKPPPGLSLDSAESSLLHGALPPTTVKRSVVDGTGKHAYLRKTVHDRHLELF